MMDMTEREFEMVSETGNFNDAERAKRSLEIKRGCTMGRGLTRCWILF
jgi:hypothetical protein